MYTSIPILNKFYLQRYRLAVSTIFKYTIQSQTQYVRQNLKILYNIKSLRDSRSYSSRTVVATKLFQPQLFLQYSELASLSCKATWDLFQGGRSRIVFNVHGNTPQCIINSIVQLSEQNSMYYVYLSFAVALHGHDEVRKSSQN